MIKFKSKVETLRDLAEIVETAKILPIQYFSTQDWLNDGSLCIENFMSEKWSGHSLIVRSSAMVEDQNNSSYAGHFKSVLNVKGKENLIDAVNNVISSFKNHSENDHIFIQPMLENVELSGVIFTRDPNTGGPYYIINYIEGVDQTDTVTGGKDGDYHTYIRHHASKVKIPDKLSPVFQLTDELSRLFNKTPIDVEFAIDNNKDIYLFQVRPLVIKNKSNIDDEEHTTNISEIASMVARSNKSYPYLAGQKTVYGVMPDWNPAEIIGTRPQPLALSLYRDLITDATWAYQRDNYGYRNLRSIPLMVSFHGLPYIDVRVSFNSFIPKDINNALAERLVNYYIDRLIEKPNLHDKVEFEIVFSCYSFNLNERLDALKNYGFNTSDIQKISSSLKNITNRIINNKTGLWIKDLEKIRHLEYRRESIVSANLERTSKVYWLIEDCRRYGTLPFAGLARAAFIAVQLLHSMVSEEILSNSDMDRLMKSLQTVSSKMVQDLHTMDRNNFLGTYGHLRPGTYDIRSFRYDENPDLYFNWDRTLESSIINKKEDFKFNSNKT